MSGRTETLTCVHCGRAFEKSVAQANRQRRVLGDRVRFYCTQQCNGASKRLGKTRAQMAEEKAAYDRVYRAKHIERIKARKREYFQQTYDPVVAAKERRKKRRWQRAYAREYNARPENKAHKAEYDRDYRAAEYGDFAECQKLLVELEKAVRIQPWYERAKERGYFDNLRQPNQRKRNEHVARY